MTDTAGATIGERIRTRMRTAGLTQQQLAEATGLSESQLSRALSGKRRLTAGELGAIADALEVSATLLLDQPVADYGLALAARLAESPHDPALSVAFSRAGELLELRAVLCRLGALVPRAQPGRSLPADPGRAAAAVRALATDDGSDAGLVALAELRLGVDVAVEPFAKGVHGLAVTDGRVALVLLNGGDSPGERDRTLARLLWRVLTPGRDVWYADVDGTRAGRRANAFADALVGPPRPVAAGDDGALCEPPSLLCDATLAAYAQGLVGIGLVAQLYAADDFESLRAELARSGWQPSYA